MNEREKAILSYVNAMQSLFMTGKAETISETVTAALIKRGIVGRVERDDRENRMFLFRRGYVGT